MLPQEVDDQLPAWARLARLRLLRAKRGPQRRILARQQGDRRRAHGSCLALAAIGPPIAGRQPRPSHMPCQASIVEPSRLVAGKTCGQNLGFPGAGGSLEAFELPDHLVERIGPLHARTLLDALPGE